jgi:hypothetical protein
VPARGVDSVETVGIRIGYGSVRAGGGEGRVRKVMGRAISHEKFRRWPSSHLHAVEVWCSSVWTGRCCVRTTRLGEHDNDIAHTQLERSSAILKLFICSA